MLNVLLSVSTHQQQRLWEDLPQIPWVWVHQAIPSVAVLELNALSFLGTMAKLTHGGLEVSVLHWAWLEKDCVFFVLSCTRQSQNHSQDLTQSLLEKLHGG